MKIYSDYGGRVFLMKFLPSLTTPFSNICGSSPSLRICVSIPHPFSTIGGPSRKPSSIKPSPPIAGSRRRVLTRHAFLSHHSPSITTPHSRRSTLSPPPSRPPPKSPAWAPAALSLKLGDVGWSPSLANPLQLPPPSAWAELPEFGLKLGDVGWRALVRPRPPRPDPP